ncbi:hypothetical protein [Microbacterium sp. 22296]
MDGNSTHDDDEVALEHWDDDGGNEAIAPLITAVSRARPPRQIAHFPPL